MFDDRLKEIAALISSGGVLCDVGSDHAYLPVYMRKNNMIRKAYALDISEINAAKAKRNITAAGEANIETLVSDGLDAVEKYSDITDIVIAGMGGENIAAILDRSAMAKSGVNLVLQSNSKTEYLRGFLFRGGYDIKEERLVRSKKFLYVIIKAEYKGENYKFSSSPADNLMGKYLHAQNSPLFAEYKEKTVKRLKATLDELYDKKNNCYLNRMTEFGSVNDIQLILSRIENK